MIKSWNVSKPWYGAVFLTLGLAWRAGLHAWQMALACLALAIIGWTSQRFWAPSTKMLLLGGLVLAWQVLHSVSPQVSFNQTLWLGALMGLGLTLKQTPKPMANDAWLAFYALALLTCVLLFGLSAWNFYANPGQEWNGTALVALSTHPFFPNQNVLGVSLWVPAYLLALTWLYEGRRIVLSWLGLALLTAALTFSGSKGVLMALILAGVWWNFRAIWANGPQKRTVLLAGLLALSLLVALKSPGSGMQRRVGANAEAKSADSFRYLRIKFWKAGLKASLERPLLGWGQGSFVEAIQRQDVGAELSERNPIARYRLKLEHAHNEFIEVAVEWGWPVLLGVLFVLARWWWKRLKLQVRDPDIWVAEAFLVGILAHACIDMPLRAPFMQLQCILAWAWIETTEVDDDVSVPKTSRNGWLVFFILLVLANFSAWLKFSALQPFETDVVEGRLTPAQAVQRRPYSAFAWLALAENEFRLKHPADALLALEHALWLEPNYMHAWQLREAWAKGAGDKRRALYAQGEIRRILALRVPQDQESDAIVQALLKPVKLASFK